MSQPTAMTDDARALAVRLRSEADQFDVFTERALKGKHHQPWLTRSRREADRHQATAALLREAEARVADLERLLTAQTEALANRTEEKEFFQSQAYELQRQLDAQSRETAALREAFRESHKFFRCWFGLGPNPNVGEMLDRMARAIAPATEASHD